MKNDPKNANKPENILEKIVVGKLGKYYEQVCLNEQEFFLDDGVTVGKYIADTAKELGAPITVRELKASKLLTAPQKCRYVYRHFWI